MDYRMKKGNLNKLKVKVKSRLQGSRDDNQDELEEPYQHSGYLQHTRPDQIEGTKRPATAFMAGYNAFLAWIPFVSNPYKDKNRGLWINGYKRAQRDTWLRDVWYMNRRGRGSRS